MAITALSKESRFEARFQKKELLAYFSHIFTEGFVLNYNLQSASPVCLPPATHLVREQLVNCVVLDTSDSMKEVFKQYLEEVKKLLSDMLSMSKVGDEILIVDFDNKTRSKAFNVMGSKQKDEAAIFAHLDSLVCSGGTRLYPTMLESLQSLLANYPGRLQSLMIITDGDGNYGNEQEPALNAHFEEFKTRPAATIPTLFTVGIGPFYKPELFVNWANRVGGQFTHIDSIAQIHHLLSNHIKTMCRSRALLRFVHGCTLKILPVYHGCPVLLPEVAIKPSETFVVNDRAYLYTSGPRDALSAEAILASLGPRRNTFSPLFSAQTDYCNSDEDEEAELTAESQERQVVDEMDFVEQMLSKVKCTIS
jgi:Mg-chelatase subunit ChlD